jgi:hypothetical protein
LFLDVMVGEVSWSKAGTRWREEREWKSNKEENGSPGWSVPAWLHLLRS